MAVIQDLPTEILTRVLELSLAQTYTFDTHGESSNNLVSTALVARCWRAPSQRLLSSRLSIAAWEARWPRYLQQLGQSNSSRLSRIERLETTEFNYTFPGTLGDLAHLAEQRVRLRELYVLKGVLELGPLHLPLLRGLEVLALAIPITFEGGSQDIGPLSLKALQIFSTLPRLPAALQPLSTVAPRLTRLELEWSRSLAGDALFDLRTLQDIAPQLKQLVLSTTGYAIGQKPNDTLPPLEPFLRACTSLNALSLQRFAAREVCIILALSCRPLTLLDLILPRLHDGQLSLTRPLVEALSLPCMAQLRQWRMVVTSTGRSTSIMEMERALNLEWRAACQARGIEPRGDERYCTD